MKAKKSKALLVFVTILSINGCNKASYKDSVAVVDDKTISKDIYTKELEFYQKFYTNKYDESYLDSKSKRGKTNKEILQENLLDSMIKDQVMINDLANNKIKLDDNTANTIKTDLEKSLGGKDSLKANVAAIGISENDFNEILYNDSIRKQHYEYFLSNNDIKDSQILDYYKKNKKYQKQYKYNALVFKDEKSAKKIRTQIKDSKDFNGFLNATIKNYDTYKSDFVYEDDSILTEAKVVDKDEVSKVFKYKDKYMILNINSYNDNENELLLKVKDIYMKEKHQDYLNRLVKKSKIKVYM